MDPANSTQIEGTSKRTLEENDDEEQRTIGPLIPGDVIASGPDEMKTKEDTSSSKITGKRKRVLKFEQLYLDQLPSCEVYEKSYMHRDVITHIITTKTDFIITASTDGYVKFWKKAKEGIDFVKTFKAHLGSILKIVASEDGLLLASISKDTTMKIYDVINFDMINVIRLPYVPKQCCWIYKKGQSRALIACSSEDSGEIYIYDSRGDGSCLHTVSLHLHPIIVMEFNALFDVVVSADASGLIEYWSSDTYQHPKNVSFEFKTDTDLYEFAKNGTVPISIDFSPNQELFATIGRDRKIRVFTFSTGRLYRVYDESISSITELQQRSDQPILKLDNMEFGRRVAIEREIEKSDSIIYQNASFDESGFFLLYPSLHGVKLINLYTNRLVKIFGKFETIRYMKVALFQGVPIKKRVTTLEMVVSDNPAFKEQTIIDPILFTSAFKKNRFYMFSTREPVETEGGDGLAAGRDVFNEKPTREEQNIQMQAQKSHLGNTTVIHTTMGDIHAKLFSEMTPKAVENFCTHAKNGYYNNLLFHRVIKGFMLQTGDPLGDGTGGESIWGRDFEDEFHPSLRHDRPYILSMANAGPNTNGSQFFITTVPCPWLDQKHTIFGHCVAGMDTINRIENVRVDKSDRPTEEIKIINITIR